MDLIWNLDIKAIVQILGYPGLFAAVFAETGVFFMFFLPGSSMLFTAGLLASQGLFNVWALLFLITLAAILGDNTGYFLGEKIPFVDKYITLIIVAIVVASLVPLFTHWLKARAHKEKMNA